MTAAPPAKSTRKPTSSPLPTKAATRERAPTASRVRKERDILQHAEIQFAQFGFQGASLENIAVAAGISRHNLLYYFPSKEALPKLQQLQDLNSKQRRDMNKLWSEIKLK